MKNRILIVDDNTINCESLKKLLSDWGECDVAHNGENALKMFHLAHAKSKPYTLMTLDIDMPGMDGIEVLENIREWEPVAGYSKKDQLKIIMISAMHNVRSDVMKSFYLGCEDYIVKPATREKLTQVLNNLGFKMQKDMIGNQIEENKIMIVDDGEQSRSIMIELLSAYGHCDTFESSQDALRAFHLAHAQEKPYDLMALDLNMSSMDTNEVIQSIREWEDQKEVSLNGKELKILMVTSGNSIQDSLKTLIKGSEKLLVKPVDIKELDKVLAELEIKVRG